MTEKAIEKAIKRAVKAEFEELKKLLEVTKRPKFLSVKDAAKITRHSEAKIRIMKDNNEFPTFVCGSSKKTLIREDDVYNVIRIKEVETN